MSELSKTPQSKILIVDDRQENIVAMEAALRSVDAKLISVDNGEDALRLLMLHDFALVLLDVQMPGMSGFEVATMMMSSKKMQRTPVVFVTADSRDEANLCEGYEAGAVDFLFKPVNSSILLAKVKVFLRLERQQKMFATNNVNLRLEAARREKAEAQLEEQLNQLADINNELDEFTRFVSHDLQEPVRKQISYGQLLREDLGDNISEDVERDISVIEDSARRMSALVKALLTLSRVSRIELQQESVSLNNCLDIALDDLEVRIEDCDAKITRDALPNVTGDQTMLTQLYQNLISNALKFIPPESSPEIHITAEQDGPSWTLGVRDNGIGMKSEFAEAIFLPFKRLHGRKEYPGTGIGLSICKKAVLRHGGNIWVESEPGQGAHFKFTLADVEATEATVEKQLLSVRP